MQVFYGTKRWMFYPDLPTSQAGTGADKEHYQVRSFIRSCCVLLCQTSCFLYSFLDAELRLVDLCAGVAASQVGTSNERSAHDDLTSQPTTAYILPRLAPDCDHNPALSTARFRV